MLKQEMDSVSKFYLHQMDYLTASMEDEENQGLLALKTKSLHEVKQTYRSAAAQFEGILQTTGSRNSEVAPSPVSADMLQGTTLVPADEEEIRLLESYLDDLSDESSDEE